MQGRDTERVKRDNNQYVPSGNGRADIAGCHQGMLVGKRLIKGLFTLSRRKRKY